MAWKNSLLYSPESTLAGVSCSRTLHVTSNCLESFLVCCSCQEEIGDPFFIRHFNVLDENGPLSQMIIKVSLTDDPRELSGTPFELMSKGGKLKKFPPE